MCRFQAEEVIYAATTGRDYVQDDMPRLTPQPGSE
jgi:hypothetical protein